MTVSKELLQDMNIISMTLQFFKKESAFAIGLKLVKQVSCVLCRYEKGLLQFNLLENINETEFDEVKMNICVQESELVFDSETATLELQEKGLTWITAKPISNPAKTIKRLLDNLAILEKQEEKFGRRKEPRIKITKENFMQFGLNSIEQKIFSKSAKIIQPCALIDVSVHGICIITPFENPAFKNLENFHIQVSFSNPEQTVILQCHKVHSKLNNTENRLFSTLSCQLLEPIHYAWKEKILNLLENEEMSLTVD